MDAFLAHVDPKAFRYKHPSDEPTGSPTGGEYLGVNAEHVAASPVIGEQIVKERADGMKGIDPLPALSAVMAGVGRLHERVEALEGIRRRA